MSGQFLWHTLRLPVDFYAQRFAGEISSRSPLNDKVADILSGRLATTVIDSLMMVFYAVIMLFYDKILTSITIIFAILNFFALQFLSRSRVDINTRLTQETGKVVGVAVGGIQAIETVKASGLESDLFAKFAGYYAKMLNAQQALALPSQILSILPTFLTALATTAILIVGGLRVMNGSLTIGMLIAYQSLTQQFLMPVNNPVNFGSTLQELEADLNRLDDVLQNPANSSQFRTRRVVLTGDWWKQEYGPLLAYTSWDKKPVALLPNGRNSYVLFDPVQRTQTLVTKAIAKTLLPDCFMFYRPLPLRIHHAVELFQFGVKGYEKNIITIIILGIIATLLGMVIPQATAILVNTAIPDSDRLLLAQIGLVLVATTIGRSTFNIAQAILSLRVENGADSVLQPAVWDRLLTLKPAFFRSYSSGDLLTRLMAVSQIRQLISGTTQRTLLNAIFSLLNLGLMALYSWQLALVGVGLTLIAILFTGVSSTLLIRQERLQETADGEINGLLIELINGVSKLRVAMAEERAFAVWAKKYSQRIQLKANIKRIDDQISVFNEILPLVSSIFIFGFAIILMQMAQTQDNSGLNMGTFLAFNAAFGIFISGVTDLSNTLTDVLGIVPLWERAKPIVQGIPEVEATKVDPGELTGKIVLDQVSFRYQKDGSLILNNISIQAEPGEFIAIVGPSGSGKSTLFRLLLGFETPDQGTIYYNDQDLAGLNIQAVRRQLGVVLQNGRINTGSIFDNITCGALVTLDQALEAAQMAGLAADIEQMPMGMHTVISEGGTNLSAGQRQRLLIARALVLKPKIVLLDEATSALDNRTQAIVSDSLEQLKATRIVIAHRLSTIRNADRIYVIEAGRLVEVGTFEELVNQKGLFARLVARQLE